MSHAFSCCRHALLFSLLTLRLWQTLGMYIWKGEFLMVCISFGLCKSFILESCRNMMDIAASLYMATLTVTTGLSAPYNNLAMIYKQQVLVMPNAPDFGEYVFHTLFCLYWCYTFVNRLYHLTTQWQFSSSLLKKGNCNHAITCFNEVLRIDPMAADCLVNRGNTFKEAGRITEAIQDYFHAVTIRPTMAEAHANLAAAYKDT